MAISPVAGTEQEITDNAGTTTVLTVSPTADNLLVLRFVGDSILSGISDNGTGSWSLIPAAYDNGFTDHRIAYKIAAGDESAITLETGNDSDRCVHYQEYEGNETTGVLDVSASANSGTGTGTTGATSQADTYACALRSNSGSPTSGFSGWTNSFTEVADLIQGAVGLGSADRTLTATGTVTTSADEDGSDAGGVVAVFKAVSGGGTDFTETPTDSEGLTDARALDYGKGLTEAEGLTDAATREFGRPAAETLGLTDAIESVVSREQTPTDALGLTDALQTESGKAAAPADDLGLTDATTIVGDFQRDQADALGLTDTIQIGGDTSLGLTDDADLTDSAVTVGDFQRTATDAIGITDALTVDVGKLASLGDDLDATDALVFDVGQGPAETVGLTDALAFEIEKVLVDAAAVADAAAVVADYERSITDAIGLTDLASNLERDIEISAALAAPRWTATLAAGTTATLNSPRWTATLEED